MPSTPTPCIVDQYGQPISSGGRWLDAADNSGRNRPAEPVRVDDINRLVPAMDRRITVALSERVITNFDVIDGALWSKAMFSVGRAWEPQFLGLAKEWGRIAASWLLNEWYKIGDIGEAPDMRFNLELDSVTIDRSGDFGILASSYEGGYPATQRIPPWRIGLPFDGIQQVQTVLSTRNPDGSPASGKGQPVEIRLPRPLWLRDGIIYDERGRRLYTRVRQDTGLSLTPTYEYEDLHRKDFWLIYDRAFYEQGRGWPSTRASINKLRDALKSHEWEQLAMLIASSIGLIEYNETGTQQTDGNDPRILTQDPGDSGAPNTPFQAETFYGGLVRFFKAGSGSKLQQFVSQRPGDPWSAFYDRIVRAALRGLNWSPMLAWGKENPGGQVARADIDQCNASVRDRQDLLRSIKAREDGYAVSKAIQLKILPPYPGPDVGGFLKWGYSFPGEISIDDGRDAQNLREDYKMGFANDNHVLAIKGRHDPETHWTERAAYSAMRKRIQALENQKPENVKLGVVVTDRNMQMLTPNEQPDGVEGTGETAGGETEEGKQKAKPETSNDED